MATKERREREKERRQSDILDAARTLLLEEGLKGTSINRIAKLSELSIGAIYSYFKDKEEIFAALQAEGLDILYQCISRARSQSAGPEDAIRLIALAYQRFSDEHKSYFDVINYFLASPKTIFTAEIKKKIDAHAAASLAILAEAIGEGVQKGIFREVVPGQEALVLWSACHGAVMLKKMEATIMGPGDYPSLFGGVIERFLSVIRAEKNPVSPSSPQAPT